MQHRLQRRMLQGVLALLSLTAGLTPTHGGAKRSAAGTKVASIAGQDDPSAGHEPADLVIRGARVLTMDPARPVATAIAIREHTIIYIGDDAGVAQWQGPRTHVLNAGGLVSGSDGKPAPAATMTVLPGLIDAHAHLVGLGLSLAQLDLRGQTSPADIIKALQQYAAKHPASERHEWLVGRGWDQNRFSPPQLPTLATRRALDQATTDRPVLLKRIDGHAVWVNSKALQLAGVDKTTKDPAGGRIEHDPSGEPTGVLVDNAADLVERLLPPANQADIEQAILAAGAYVTARGLTSVHEMGISPDAISVYRRLAEQGRMPLRVYAFADDPMPRSLAQLPFSLAYNAELAHLSERLGPPESGAFFSLRGIKLYLDGALGSRGAALLEPYSDEPKNSGLLLTPPEHVEAMARWAQLHGWQLATHAIGDRASQLALDAYEQAGVRDGKGVRFRIEHAQVVSPVDLAHRRFAQLGVIASIQPTHATSDMSWAGARLGPTRLRTAYAWQSLLRSGTRIAGGSDFPVEDADPRLGLHAAVLRQTVDGQPPEGFAKDQRLSVGEAIRAFTTDAAYAAFAENQQGMLQVGRPADVTVLQGSLDLDAGEPPLDLPKRRVLLTIIDGQVVHGAELFQLAPRGPSLAKPATAPRHGRNSPKSAQIRQRRPNLSLLPR